MTDRGAETQKEAPCTLLWPFSPPRRRRHTLPRGLQPGHTSRSRCISYAWSPGTALEEVPTTETEQPGMGAALGVSSGRRGGSEG